VRSIAVVNQKGGCGKTTTVTNLAGCLAEEGQRVLVIDMDPQAHATIGLGVDPEALD
jgi:chromosome partitioning protein